MNMKYLNLIFRSYLTGSGSSFTLYSCRTDTLSKLQYLHQHLFLISLNPCSYVLLKTTEEAVWLDWSSSAGFWISSRATVA